MRSSFVYKLINKGIKIWSEGKNLKLSIPEGIALTNAEKDFLKKNKDSLLDFLISNEVYSKDHNFFIYRDHFEFSPLSSAQERLWFIEQFEEGTNAYNVPMIFSISVNANVDILVQSIKDIVLRHEILRTIIKEDHNNTPYQHVLDTNELEFDVSRKSVTDIDELDQELVLAANYIFNLYEEHPIKVSIYNISNTNQRYISVVIHHIAFDGWSVDIFLKELWEYYNYNLALSLGKKRELALGELKIHYKDFAIWQKHNISGEKLKEQLEYWKRKLDGFEDLNLITDNPRPRKFDYKGKDISFLLDSKLSSSLRQVAKDLRVSLFSVLLSGYYLMLWAYSKQKDIIVGTPVANRHYSEVENLIGFFVNSLALRITIDQQMDIKEYITKVSEEVIQAQVFQDLPFEMLVGEIINNQNTSKHPIFQVLFVVQSFGSEVNNGGDGKDDISSLIKPYEKENIIYNIARFDISTYMDDSKEAISGRFNYATSIYEESTIQAMISTYKHILQQLASFIQADNNSYSLADLAYISYEDLNKVLCICDKSLNIEDLSGTIHGKFEEQVIKTPKNIALKSGNVELSYEQLNQRSNQLARYITSKKNIIPDSLVALFLDRSEIMIESILGVLKSGAGYIPIDTSYPEERIKYILEDTKTSIILTNQRNKNFLKDLILSSNISTEIYCIDGGEEFKEIRLQSKKNLEISTKGNNLAYVIYTSGTTGKPKGVMIEHNSFIRTIMSIQELYFKTKEKLSTYSVTNYVFDIFGLEYGLPLFTGGTIELGSQNFISLNCNNYDFIQLTPTLCEAKSDDIIDTQKCILLIGGENLSNDLLRKVIKYFYNVINLYGPTETTIWSTSKIFNQDSLISSFRSNIGKALPGERVYILDDLLRNVPYGAPGEIYIGGSALGKGYINKPELTNEKFIHNPYQTERETIAGINNRIYKSGDIGRYLSDGSIEYIGRNDKQIKINGYRIELGEIENALLNYNDIKQCAVIVKENNMAVRYLVAYYTSHTKQDHENIVRYLERTIPLYMIPSHFVYIEEMPMNLNGKLDIGKLPEPAINFSAMQVLPKNDIEYKLCRMWADILGINEKIIGIHDNFFQLGGNSLLSIKLLNKINNEIGIRLNVADIFNNSTIGKIIRYLAKVKYQENTFIEATGTISEKFPLSFSQERLWFIEQFEEGTNAYNIPMIFSISANANIDILVQSIKDIILRHEILRTIIKEDYEECRIYQYILDTNELEFDVSRKSVTDIDELDQELVLAANYIFNLYEEHPIKVSIYNISNTNQRYISVVIHHIAFDGWSVDIFLKELWEYYNYNLALSLGKKRELALGELKIHYKDFAIWQKHNISGEKLKEQLEYWKRKLDGFEDLNLITDNPRPRKFDYKGKDISFLLDSKLSSSLRQVAKDLRVSLFSVLLSGYYLMLWAYSKQKDIIVGTPVANRHYSEVENLIGFFVNSLALRITIDQQMDIKEYITKVSEEVIQAQVFQDLPFEMLVGEIINNQNTSKHPIFQVLFVVQSFGSEVNNGGDGKDDISSLIKPYEKENIIYNIARFDISTYMDDSKEAISGRFNYATSIYEESTIQAMISTYKHILQQLASFIQADNNSYSLADFNLQTN